jgi:putative ABC transport system permease protein
MLIRQFLRDLRQQKLRTMITIMGIAWGTVAVVFLQGIGEGFQTFSMRAMHGMGESIAILSASKTTKPFEGMGRGRQLSFIEADVKMLRTRIPTISEISPELRGGGKIKIPGETVLDVGVSGMYPEWGDMRSIIPEPGGRFFNDLDLQRRRRVTFIGNKLRDDLFGKGKDALGRTVMLNGTPFLVVGVMQEKVQNSSYNGRDSEDMFMPYSTMRAMFKKDKVNNIIYRAREPEMMAATTDQVYKVLAARYKFDPNDNAALRVWDTTESDRFINGFFMGFRLFLGLVAVMTLIVGGIGVANIMNAVVEERQREIGIKIAVGATPRNIMFSILGEATLLSVIGGLLGIGFCMAMFQLAPMLGVTEFMDPPTLSMPVGVLTAGILTLITLCAGYFPARRASQLQPVDALR